MATRYLSTTLAEKLLVLPAEMGMTCSIACNRAFRLGFHAESRISIELRIGIKVRFWVARVEERQEVEIKQRNMC